MAKMHPQETVLYGRIKEENITIDPLVWDTLYFYLGDYVSGINLIASFYLEKEEPVSITDGRRILMYTKKINSIVDKILHHEKMREEGVRLERIREAGMVLHPVIRELVSHYVSNDIQCINFIVGFHLDPDSEEPIPLEDAQKIVEYTLNMNVFLDKLRRATQQDAGF